MRIGVARRDCKCSIQVDEASTQLQVDLEQARATALNQASSLHFELDAGHRAVSEQESRVSTAFRARCSASCSIQVDETSTQLQVDLEQALATALNQASPLRFELDAAHRAVFEHDDGGDDDNVHPYASICIHTRASQLCTCSPLLSSNVHVTL